MNSKQIAFANIIALETAADKLGGPKAKSLRQQALELRVKWGVSKSERLDVETQWENQAQKRIEKPVYRNSKYALEKYAKVDPKHKDQIGRYYFPSAVQKATKRPETIEVVIYE